MSCGDWALRSVGKTAPMLGGGLIFKVYGYYTYYNYSFTSLAGALRVCFCCVETICWSICSELRMSE